MGENLWLILILAALGVILCTIAGFFGKTWWLFDLFSHFRLQYLILLAVFTLLFAAGGRLSEAILSGAFALVNLLLILPLYRKAHPAVTRGIAAQILSSPNPSISDRSSLTLSNENHRPKVRVLLANVLQRNRQFHRVRELIRSAEPDIILLVEINRTWVKELEPELAAYPHCLTALRDDNYGLGLFSKLPGNTFDRIVFSDAQYPSIVARLSLDGQPFTIVGTHPPPPRRPWLAWHRDHQLKEIAKYVAAHPAPALVLGDFNNTSWSPHFQETLRLGRLKDSRQGFGLQPSWPVDRPWFLVPIDHILITEGIIIHRRWRGPFTGSDHYPILLEFSLCPSPSIK